MGKPQDWSVLACVFLFLSLASQIHCTRTGSFDQQKLRNNDLIKKLPGQPDVSFRQYGGYIPINEKAGRFYYYYFVEAINNTASTPLVIWFNGGPGCSSLVGALKSLGPFRVHSNGKTLYQNPYSWNNKANVLFLETPIGVGFSYSKTPLNLTKEGTSGDKRTTKENYIFLVNWLQRFPKYKNRELYLTGQSYAGHFVPQLAQTILNHNNRTFINLKGIMIGNPTLDQDAESFSDLEFLKTHGIIPREYFDGFMKSCVQKFDDSCIGMMDKVYALRKDYDLYNIYAPLCINSTLSSEPKKMVTITEYDPCMLNYMTTYLNTKKVQKAMHANSTKIPYAWEHCNMPLNKLWNESHLNAKMQPILREVMDKGVRVWLYSGDIDSNVPVTITMDILKLMNLTVEKAWRSWFIQGQVGGYTEDYKGNFKFTTVRGAGHSVPTDKPISALTLFTSFLRNAPLPQKNQS